ncbi:MAG: hypothetical protein ACFFG0_01035 [Candidatus Thorarchaeota archaeon]
MKIIGVIGTRKRNTSAAFKKIKEKFFEIYEEGDWICSGGCSKGGDRCAEQIAKSSGIPILTFYPNYKRFQGGATFARNTDIAQTSHVIIACVMRPEEGLDEVLKRDKGGSEDTLRKFVDYIENQGLIPEVYLV